MRSIDSTVTAYPRPSSLQTCWKYGVQSKLLFSSWSQPFSSCRLTSRKSVKSTLLKTSQPLITWYRVGPEPMSTSSSPLISPKRVRAQTYQTYKSVWKLTTKYKGTHKMHEDKMYFIFLLPSVKALWKQASFQGTILSFLPKSARGEV